MPHPCVTLLRWVEALLKSRDAELSSQEREELYSIIAALDLRAYQAGYAVGYDKAQKEQKPGRKKKEPK